MGVDPISIALGVGSFILGVEGKKSADRQAGLIESEASRAARIREEEIHKFRENQRVEFLKSGVKLEGTPLLVLEETRKKGIQEVESIRASGRARAGAVRARGRAALLGGLLGFGGGLARGGVSLPSFGATPSVTQTAARGVGRRPFSGVTTL